MKVVTAFAILALLAASAPAPAAEEFFHKDKATITAFPREVASNGAITFKVRVGREYRTPILAVTFPDGTPAAVTDRWTKHIEDSFWRVAERLREEDEPIAKTRPQPFSFIAATAASVT